MQRSSFTTKHLCQFCDCLFDNVRLEYLGDGDVKNPDGVKTRVPDGTYGMDGVTCLVPELCSSSKNWYDVIHALQVRSTLGAHARTHARHPVRPQPAPIPHTQAAGYTPGTDLFALPYDFRRGPKQYMGHEYPALKELIETAFTSSGNQKVVLSSISMGGPFGHTFLTQYVDQGEVTSQCHSNLPPSSSHPRHLPPLRPQPGRTNLLTRGSHSVESLTAPL